MSRGLLARDGDGEDASTATNVLELDFSKLNCMEPDWVAHSETTDNVQVPEYWLKEWKNDHCLRIYFDENHQEINLSDLAFNTSPKYVYEYTDPDERQCVIESNYSVAGYTSIRGGQQLRFTTDQTVGTVDFGEYTFIKVYVAWSPEYILSFDSDDTHYGEGESSGYMAPMKLSQVGGIAPQCTFNHPLGSRKRFTYFNDPSWQDTTSYTSDDVDLYALKYWNCAIGSQGFAIREGDPINLTLFNLDAPPVVKMTAYWERAYDVLKFNIGDATYCEVCISTKLNRVVYPDHAPVMQPEDGNLKFYGWDASEGDYLPGVNRNPTVICGDSKYNDQIICDSESSVVCEPGEVIFCGNPDVVCHGDTDNAPIVCKDEEVDYITPINAYLVEHIEREFAITFRYMDDNGKPKTHVEKVPQNRHLPSFHIHNSYVVENEDESTSTFMFRHWLLASGNLTSSLTVLSDLTFVAVYDETKDVGTVDSTTDELGQGYVFDPIEQESVDSSESQLICCRNYREYSDGLKHTHEGYCALTGLDPRKYEDHFEELDNCPYVKILRDLYGEDCPTPKSAKNDLKQTTIIEIEDISNLLKALFKVNMDIAHREYFLKIDVPEESNWWYGLWVKPGDVLCTVTDPVICEFDDDTRVVCGSDGTQMVSFEPYVELKFSNLHSDNQLDEEGNLVCTVDDELPRNWRIVPVNRELAFSNTNKCVQYNDIYYFYDYTMSWKNTWQREDEPDSTASVVEISKLVKQLTDAQNFYEVLPLRLYENTQLQLPTNSNDYVRHRLGPISRNSKQVRTFTSIVKKYRPVIMPQVRDIFNDCHVASATKYDADVDNNYGVFGWCTIPSKTMVNMEYNEGALYVPSSYDHHNRVSGSNFLQMDNDFKKVYRVQEQGNLVDNAKNTWVWLYNTRDWTYFAKPFFDVGRNNEVYSTQLDDFDKDLWPENSNHLNGVIFEKAASGRVDDLSFLGIAQSCQFLARFHHNESNLKVLAERYTNLLPYSTLKELTNHGEFNDVYGSEYPDIPLDYRLSFQDWIDDYNKTSSFVNLKIGDYMPDSTESEFVGDRDELKYKYNLGQSHAIDDYDENSVWFYITMVSPLEELDSVIELEDIMPYVFWWENRGTENNGPDVDCYGLASSSKLNYEQGGWCHSLAHEGLLDDVWVDPLLTPQEQHKPRIGAEHRWHAVSNTLGVDFSKKDNGGTLLTTDNSGNVYKGAFDPNCAGTDEKWKIHHLSNAFGANQHEDPTADKYYLGDKAHGDGQFQTKVTPSELNDRIMESIKDRPMTWNLWNVVRHYVYIKYFKNRHKALGTDAAAWADIEKYTKKLVKGIYRTFKQNKTNSQGERSTFSNMDDTSTNYGSVCQVHWTNSFIEVSTILERNAREHMASFVLFTGDIPRHGDDAVNQEIGEIQQRYRDDYQMEVEVSSDMARASLSYKAIMNSHNSFRVTTNSGVDADDSEDGTRPRKELGDSESPYDERVAEDGSQGVTVFQGFKYGDLPTTYLIGDGTAYAQRQQDVQINFKDIVDLDQMYPESEYYLNDTLRKWVRKIRMTMLNKQILPIYTSMENMTTDVHELTVDEMKGITFQVVPSFYWKYDWSYNEFMIHRVGKLASPSKNL